MPRKTVEDRLTIKWLPEMGPLQAETVELKDGKLAFNPFIETQKVQSIDTQLDVVKEAWLNGQVSDEDAMAAMGRIYTVNHSVGRDVLSDNRLKVENRIARYVNWAVGQGQDPVEAKRYAIGHIMDQGVKQGGSLAGKAWGGIRSSRDIRDK